MGANAHRNTHEITANIVLDKGLFGAEFALIFTIPDFENKIRPCLDATAKYHVSMLHNW